MITVRTALYSEENAYITPAYHGQLNAWLMLGLTKELTADITR